MEFQGKPIPGTNKDQRLLYVGNLPYLYPDIAERATAIDLSGQQGQDDLTEATSEFFKGIDISDAEDNAEWMLLNDPIVYDFNYLRVHLAEITGKPYVRLGEKDAITELKEDGITVEDDNYTLNQYLEEMFEKARQELRTEISLGEIAVYAVDPTLLNEEDKYSLESGLSYELIIEKLENMVAEEIADAYIKRLDECRADGADYGLNTAIALAKEKPFKGTRDFARALVRWGLLTDAEYAELEKYELISKAITKEANKPLEGDDVGSGYAHSERFGAMHESCYTVGYPCEGCGFGEHTIDDASINDKEK